MNKSCVKYQTTNLLFFQKGEFFLLVREFWQRLDVANFSWVRKLQQQSNFLVYLHVDSLSVC